MQYFYKNREPIGCLVAPGGRKRGNTHTHTQTHKPTTVKVSSRAPWEIETYRGT